MTTRRNRSGEAVIERDQIVIRVAVNALAHAVRYGPTPEIEITDAVVFAKELVSALNDESEDGSTPIHRMLDAAVAAAVNAGAEGWEERTGLTK